MSPDRLATWIRLHAVTELEVSCNGDCFLTETIDGELTEEEASLLARDVFEDMTQHAEETQQKSVRFVVKGHTPEGAWKRFHDSIRIVNRGAGQDEMLKELLSNNREMHKLMIAQQENSRKFNESIMKQNQVHMKTQLETLDLLKQLRTEALDQELKKDAHERNLEMRERLTDNVVPIVSAFAHRVTKGALPAAVDTEALAIKNLVQAYEPDQLDAIANSLPIDLRNDFNGLCERANEGQAKLEELRDFIVKLGPEKTQAIVGTMNPGQQMAVHSLLG